MRPGVIDGAISISAVQVSYFFTHCLSKKKKMDILHIVGLRVMLLAFMYSCLVFYVYTNSGYAMLTSPLMNQG